MSSDGKLFRSVMGSFATGVTVVSTRDHAGNPYGVTVNSFTSVSLDPPLLLVCLDNRLAGLAAFLESRELAVNILKADQIEVSNHYASRGSDRSRHLTGRGVTGIPLVENCLAWIECRLAETFGGGDHTILLAEVLHLSVCPSIEESEPLLFYRGRYRRLGQ